MEFASCSKSESIREKVSDHLFSCRPHLQPMCIDYVFGMNGALRPLLKPSRHTPPTLAFHDSLRSACRACGMFKSCTCQSDLFRFGLPQHLWGSMATAEQSCSPLDTTESFKRAAMPCSPAMARLNSLADQGASRVALVSHDPFPYHASADCFACCRDFYWVVGAGCGKCTTGIDRVKDWTSGEIRY